MKKETEIVNFVFDKYLNENYELIQISTQLNEMGYRTNNNNYFETRGIKYILENPIYSGFIERNKALKSIIKAIYVHNKNKKVKIQYYLNKEATDIFTK